MRINGRLLRPSSLAERRTMLSLGLTSAFRCPRSENPFSLARKLRRLAAGVTSDAEYLRRIAAKKKKLPTSPPELPDSHGDGEQAA